MDHKLNKKICFAVLVHENKEQIKQLLSNIKHYCPNSFVVLYNGGNDPSLCANLNVDVCPFSKKLHYGNLSQYFIETMEWLEDIECEYDYLINIDSDALFFRTGFEEFIEEQMQDADYMAVRLRVPDKDWTCGKSFKKDKSRWSPFFSTNTFLGVFNVGQVFSKVVVEALINYEKKAELRTALRETTVFGIEEIVFVNLINELGYTMKAYPDNVGEKLIRFRPYLTRSELIACIIKKEGWLAHPINRNTSDPARTFIHELQFGKGKTVAKKRTQPISRTFSF